jgi:hypothetical protein
LGHVVHGECIKKRQRAPPWNCQTSCRTRYDKYRSQSSLGTYQFRDHLKFLDYMSLHAECLFAHTGSSWWLTAKITWLHREAAVHHACVLGSSMLWTMIYSSLAATRQGIMMPREDFSRTWLLSPVPCWWIVDKVRMVRLGSLYLPDAGSRSKLPNNKGRSRVNRL